MAQAKFLATTVAIAGALAPLSKADFRWNQGPTDAGSTYTAAVPTMGSGWLTGIDNTITDTDPDMFLARAVGNSVALSMVSPNTSGSVFIYDGEGVPVGGYNFTAAQPFSYVVPLGAGDSPIYISLSGPGLMPRNFLGDLFTNAPGPAFPLSISPMSEWGGVDNGGNRDLNLNIDGGVVGHTTPAPGGVAAGAVLMGLIAPQRRRSR